MNLPEETPRKVAKQRKPTRGPIISASGRDPIVSPARMQAGYLCHAPCLHMRSKADMQRASRMRKEVERLRNDPPHGVSCWPKEGRIDCLEAKLVGSKDTPYEGGIFKLEIKIPERYPFEPPQVQFLTKIYHPNIDTAGRICLDVLKSPPQGSWKPAHNISTVLTSIQLLVSEPNPDDGLMADISHEYKHNRPRFVEKAKEWVQMYAKEEDNEELEEGKRNVKRPLESGESEPATKHYCPDVEGK